MAAETTTRRRRGTETRKRTARVVVRFLPDELGELEQLAREHGVGLATFLRDRALSREVTPAA